MATVRIYQIAEILGTTSQEVIALFRREHGIEVKSASSSVEEIVARQFVERLARERGITLPSGDPFAKGAAAKVKKPTPGKKAEPPAPAKPSLPPPRLVKAAKVARPEPAADVQAAEEAEEQPAPAPTEEAPAPPE
ncbi:MAG: translation initiation factor IF-2 N-terminal domain-containing protein, partial [Acidobacteriota bacterium]